MSGTAAKKPQDRKPKKAAVDRLQAEAQQSVTEGLLGREVTVVGRVGTVTVTVLDDPMEWDADVIEILDRWATLGGAPRAEVIPLLDRIISLEDGARLKEIRPTMQAAESVAQWLFSGADESGELEPGEQTPVESLGESQAS